MSVVLLLVARTIIMTELGQIPPNTSCCGHSIYIIMKWHIYNDIDVVSGSVLLLLGLCCTTTTALSSACTTYNLNYCYNSFTRSRASAIDSVIAHVDPEILDDACE
jgi:hypothetical protein